LTESVSVRRAQPADLDSLLALYTELAEGRDVSVPAAAPAAAPILAAIVADPARHLRVATVGGKAVGSVDMVVVPNVTHHGRPWAVVENVIVAEAHRRTGVGACLITVVLDEARAAGCYKVLLHSGKQRTWAHSFYRSLGFEAVAEGFKFYFDR